MSLAPITFQKPPDKDWTALFAWLDQHAIDTGTIAHQSLEYDDICYFYVRRGKWLLNPKTAVLSPDAARPWDFILTKVTPSQQFADAAIAFQSGNLILRRSTPVRSEQP
jgi:hypothetical protein